MKIDGVSGSELHGTDGSDFVGSGSAPIPTVENVIWTDVINAAVIDNSLQKNLGCNGCQDAGAISLQEITSGDGYLEFTASETTTQRVIGLSSANTDTTISDIDFGILLWPDGGIDVRENGLYKTWGIYGTGDIFRIAVESGAVKYYKNGSLFYVSANAPTLPLLVDTSFLTSGGTLTNAVISAPQAMTASIQ